MPTIIIQCGAGKTVDQKRGLIKDITAAACKNFGVPPETVRINLFELPKENQGRAGKLRIDE